MFSIRQKRQIADRVQKMIREHPESWWPDTLQRILRDTDHPELPAEGEIKAILLVGDLVPPHLRRVADVDSGEVPFLLKVEGAESWSWAAIRNNGAVPEPGANPWNELMDPESRKEGA